MSEVDLTTGIAICLDKETILKAAEKLRDKEDWWVRIVVESDQSDAFGMSINVYLQGPDGEEDVLYHNIY